MPCLILTGYPSAGKSTVADLIRKRAIQHESGRIQRVVVVSEVTACPIVSNQKQDASSWHQTCYGSSQAEKQTRAALKTEFDRVVLAMETERNSESGNKTLPQSLSSSSTILAKDNIIKDTHRSDTLILLDSMNYIKGFRYELYCISKAAKESHAVVWIRNDPDVCLAWNRQRRQQQIQHDDSDTSVSNSCSWSDDLMEGLMQRYEVPDSRNRWDQPLYTIDLRSGAASSTSPSGLSSSSLRGADAKSFVPSVYNMHNVAQVLQENHSSESRTTSAIAPSLTTLGSTSTTGNNHGTAITIKPTQSSAFKRSGTRRAAALGGNIHSSSSNASPPIPILTSDPASVQVIPESSNGTDTVSAMTGNEAFHLEQKHHPSKGNNQDDHSVTQAASTSYASLLQQIDDMLNSFLLQVAPLREGTSTRQHMVGDADVLHYADLVTQQVCAQILSGQEQVLQIREPQIRMDNNSHDGTMLLQIRLSSDSIEGDKPPTENTEGANEYPTIDMTLPWKHDRAFTANDLRRLRSQFLQWISTYPPSLCSPKTKNAVEMMQLEMARRFLAYLETQHPGEN